MHFYRSPSRAWILEFRPFGIVIGLIFFSIQLQTASAEWKRHVVFEGASNQTAIAGDFTKDGRPDVITSAGGKTRLFVAPDWKEIILDDTDGYRFIHSETWDIDGDGDLDYIGARYQPGLIVWLEQPDDPLNDKWLLRIISEDLNGIHGVIQGDVDGDGRLDILGTSAQPVKTKYPESLVWLRAPANPKSKTRWDAYSFADRDAPGLTHYLGFGDVNGDGRPDAASGAKGKPSPNGNYFAWWEAGKDPREVWKKHMIAEGQIGATNVHPADVNRDDKVDFVASRGHGQGVVWFEAPEWKEHGIHPTLKEPHSLLVTDMDGDGDLDAATCAFGDKEAWWFENDGHGRFMNHLVTTNQEAYDIRAFDMDLDGDLDLLIGGRGSNNVVWCENPRL